MKLATSAPSSIISSRWSRAAPANYPMSLRECAIYRANETKWPESPEANFELNNNESDAMTHSNVFRNWDLFTRHPDSLKIAFERTTSKNTENLQISAASEAIPPTEFSHFNLSEISNFARV